MGRRELDKVVDEVLDVSRSMWRKRWPAIAVAWLVAVAGAVVVYLIPNRYEASARVYVDTQTVLKPLMSGLAVQPDIDLQVSMLARTLISRANIEKVIETLNFDHEVQALSGDRSRLIDSLMRKVVLQSGGKNLYSISYRDTNPTRARKLVENLVTLFVDTGLGEKKKDTEEAKRFIDEQIAAYEGKLSEAENRLKEFKMRNFGYAVGGGGGDRFAQMTTLSDDLGKLRIDLRAAEQSRDALRRELSGEQPSLPVDANPVASANVRATETEVRLEAQQRQLDELLRRFTENHPDVITTRRLVAQLEQQKKQEADAKRAAVEAGAKTAGPTNPIFQQIKILLTDAESRVAALRTRVADQQARLDELRNSAVRVPKMEADLAQLNRDYDVIRKNYEQLVSRRESVSLAAKVDSSEQLAVFKVIEPALVSPNAVFPSRIAMIGFLFIGSLGAGVLASLVLVRIVPTFESVRSLREFTKRPVLGTVSVLTTPELLKSQRLKNAMFGGATTCLFLVHAGWLIATRLRSGF